MKQALSFPIIAILLVAGCASPSSSELEALKTEVAALKAQTGPPPSALDQFYPPAAQAPIYQIKMHELANPMSGMIADVMEGDAENVNGGYAAFKAAYMEVAEMVPEWKSLFPMEPVESLGTALQSGDQNAVMAAVQSVGAVCHDCHVNNIVRVQQKYHWPDFSKASALDPISGQEIVITAYMQAMEGSFSGVMSSLQQGQLDRARGYYREFSGRFVGLAELCINCHDTEREYFIDESVQRLVRGIGTELEATSPDAGRIGQLAQQIGEEACFRCHMVHLPAALAQIRFSTVHQAN